MGGAGIDLTFISLCATEIYLNATNMFSKTEQAYSVAPISVFSDVVLGAYFHLMLSTTFSFSFLFFDCSFCENWHWQPLWKTEAEKI